MGSGVTPELNVILAGWWRPVSDADSGQRRLTPFPNVADRGASHLAWKIYSGYFRDPDGHLWEIIWNARSGGDN